MPTRWIVEYRTGGWLKFYYRQILGRYSYDEAEELVNDLNRMGYPAIMRVEFDGT